MTLDVVAAVSVVAGVVGIAGGIVAWVARTTVLNRIDSLEDSRDGMGKRFGDGQHELRAWQREHDAVERYKQGRYP